MEREDYDMPFMQRYENIAWYEGGLVRILDRRCYPSLLRFEECKSHLEVRDAIRNMVTQSAGPYTAVGMGMALAAKEAEKESGDAFRDYLEKASLTLSSARPTTKVRMAAITESCIPVAERAREEGRDAAAAVRDHVIELNNIRYSRIDRIAGYLSSIIPDGASILTQCYADTVLGLLSRHLRKEGKKVSFFCPETRPFFQGARFTATVLSEMGHDTTVITDNMPAFLMSQGKVDLFFSAADAITMDGFVVNKVGTLQIAICAERYGIPYYVTGDPDRKHTVIDDVTIEMRDGSETLQAMGVRTAMGGIKGWYPAFDITPPGLVRGVITDMGIYSPFSLLSYYNDGGEGEY